MPLSMRSTKLTARDIARLAVATAVLFAAKEVLAALPNIEVVTVLLLVYTLTFGRKTLWIIVSFVVLELLLYPVGTWWAMYLYIWPLWYGLVRLLSRLGMTPLLWACAAGAYGLAFGALCIPAHIVFHGLPGAFGWWVAGIPFDLIHGGANFALTLVLMTPLHRVLLRREEGNQKALF